MSACDWRLGNEALLRYHDEEWGVPVHDDAVMFEHLMMEVMQCGLSWNLMLQKREIFRACFDGFDYDRIARYGETDVERIMSAPGMIRSRRKIEAVIRNARHYREMRAEFGSFCDWLWAYAGGKTILYHGHDTGNVPVSNGLSDAVSRELKRRGFQYVGPITVYSHLQACGIINDHCRECGRRQYLIAHYPTVTKRRRLEKL